MNEFASKDYTAGQLNAMVKKLMEQVGEKGPDLLLQGKLKIEILKDKIINWLGTTTVPATTEKFVACEQFVKNSKEVKFYGFWDNFTNWFLSGDGKIEEPIGESELRYGKLTKGSVDSLIIEELGGEEKSETTLTEMFALLKKQANGKEGALLTNGRANIFYIRDATGVLRTVRVYWNGHDYCWGVGAFPVEDTSEWYADDQVVSRNY
jgi:hypothetical protein